MRVVIFFFVQLAILVAIGLFLQSHPGAVTLEWLGYRIETSMGVLAVALAVLVVVAVFVHRLLRTVILTPGRLADWWVYDREKRGYKALSTGLVAAAAGDTDETQRQAKRAGAMLHDAPLARLLSAQAAQMRGEEDSARRYFETMLEESDTAFLGLRGLLMQALRAGDSARALELAEQAHALRPKAPWVLQTLVDLRARAEQWPKVLETVTQAAKVGAYTPAEANHVLAVANTEAARAAVADGDVDAGLRHIRQALKAEPGFAPAAVHLADLHRAAGKPARAADALIKAWTNRPHPSIADQFRNLYADNKPAQRAKRLRALAAANPDHPESHLVLAELAIDEENWEEARRELQQVSEDAVGARGYMLLAEVEDRAGTDPAAVRELLDKAAMVGQHVGWQCDHCGTQVGEWASHCPKCGSFATIAWQTLMITPDSAHIMITAPKRPPAPSIAAPADPPAGAKTDAAAVEDVKPVTNDAKSSEPTAKPAAAKSGAKDSGTGKGNGPTATGAAKVKVGAETAVEGQPRK